MQLKCSTCALCKNRLQWLEADFHGIERLNGVLDQQTGLMYCDDCIVDFPRCYYCNGLHEDNPCYKRVQDAERFIKAGKEIYR